MNITVLEGSKRFEIEFEDGDTILSALQRAGVKSAHAPCGGKGVCKKCSVYVRSNDFCGTCLSCLEKARDGMIVELSPVVRLSFAEDSSANVYAPDPGQSGYAVAVDVGTVTVMCRLLSLETGSCVASVSGSNVQSIFGANVLARLQAAAEGHAQDISGIVINQINGFISSMCREAGVDPSAIKRVAFSGNTIMEHFAAGLNPAELGIAPFKPLTTFGETVSARDTGYDFDADAYFCPCISGFLGGDITSGMLSTGMADSEKPVLLVDLGANSEMILGCGERFVACTADAGAAFKASLLDKGMPAAAGAVCGVEYSDGEMKLKVLGNMKPVGVCGSGFIDALGIMYRLEVLDELGHIVPADEADPEAARFIGEAEGSRVFFLTEDKKVFITQKDISKFQLAKAAISAGIQILAEEYGIRLNDISRVCLAGGFGAFVRPDNAAAIGLIPSELLQKAELLGNASIAGASSAALSAEARDKMRAIRDSVRFIDLPTHPSFSDAYVDGMMFE